MAASIVACTPYRRFSTSATLYVRASAGIVARQPAILPSRGTPRDDEPPNTKCDNDAMTIPTMDNSDNNNHDDDDDDDDNERSYF